MINRWITGFAVMTTCLLQANASDQEQIGYSLRMVDEQVLPALAGFAESTTALSTASAAFCDGVGDLEPVRQQFQLVADDWQRVQWLRKGPAEFSIRHQRIALWPDKHDTGARQFRALMMSEDESVIEVGQFTNGSVAIQGIPALERLLYDVASSATLTAGEQNPFGCRYLQAISANLDQIATGLQKDWVDVYRPAMATPDGGNAFFESAKGISAEFMSQLVTQLQFVLEQKMERPLNLSPEVDLAVLAETDLSPRLRRAENWRSGRALRNIRINLATLGRAWETALKPLIAAGAEAQRIDDAFADTRQRFDALPDGYDQALDTDSAPLIDAVESLRTLFTIAQRDLPAALDIPLGFNGLDGD